MARFIDKLDKHDEKRVQPQHDMDLIQKYNTAGLLLREDFNPKQEKSYIVA